MKVILEFAGITKDATCFDELRSVDGAVQRVDSKGFGGLSVLTYILSIGSGALIIQLAKTIRKAMERNQYRSVKVNGIEITGYSFEQTKELLTLMSKTQLTTAKGKK